MNYNAVLAKKDGSYIPIRHDFETHGSFVRNYKQDYDDAIDSGKYQIIAGDSVVDVEDVSHIQPVYEDDEVDEEKEEQGGTKGMQLYGENFMAEGDPYELAVFAKNLEADEIRMSDCCEDEVDCCCGCDCDVDDTECCIDNVGNVTMSGIIDESPCTWSGIANLDIGKVKDQTVIVLRLPEFVEMGSEADKKLQAHIKEQYGEEIKVITLPSHVDIMDSNF